MGGIIDINLGDGRTVNIRNSGSLSSCLGGVSGRLVLRWWALLSGDSFAGHSGLYCCESLVVSILVCVCNSVSAL